MYGRGIGRAPSFRGLGISYKSSPLSFLGGEDELCGWNEHNESYFIVHVFFTPGYIVRSGSLIVEVAAIHRPESDFKPDR